MGKFATYQHRGGHKPPLVTAQVGSVQVVENFLTKVLTVNAFTIPANADSMQLSVWNATGPTKLAQQTSAPPSSPFATGVACTVGQQYFGRAVVFVNGEAGPPKDSAILMCV